jgi:hypothetical protein
MNAQPMLPRRKLPYKEWMGYCARGAFSESRYDQAVRVVGMIERRERKILPSHSSR